MVVHWSFVERGIDTSIAVIFHEAGGNTIEPELPRMYKRKTKFLRKCFNKLPPLAGFAAEGRALLGRASALVGIRHTVIHGVLSGDDPETQTVTLIKLDVQGTLHHQECEKLTFREMLSAGTQCHDLGTEMTAFTKRLLKAFVPEDRLKEAFGNL